MGNWRFGAFPKLPYSTMQQLNLDWILDRIRRFLPDNGTKGQVLTRTKDGAAWQDVSAVAGSVNSVNGKTGDVVLTASDVGALPSSYQAPVTSVNGMTGDVVISGGGAVDSVNGKTGTVVLTASDVGALPSSTVIPDSTSDLVNDSGFVTAAQAAAAAPVQSVNAKTGAVVLNATDVGALPASLYPTTFHEEVTQINNGVIEKTLTVAGTGFLIISNSIQSDSTADTGAVRAIIDVNNVRLAYNQNNMDNARAYPIGASCTAAALVNDGDTILLSTSGTKNGSKFIYRHILCFGCTVS